MPQNRLSELTNPSPHPGVPRPAPAILPDASSVFGHPRHTHLVHVPPTPAIHTPPHRHSCRYLRSAQTRYIVSIVRHDISRFNVTAGRPARRAHAMSTEKWIIQVGESRVIDLGDVRKLKVGILGGRVNVIAHDETSCGVEITGITGKDLKVEIDGDSLEIDHAQLRGDNFLDVFKGWVGSAKAQVSVLAPRDVTLKLGVVSGDALISGFTTGVKASAVSGELVLDGIRGDAELSSVSGEISASNHVGRVNAHTVSGDVVATGHVYSFSVDTVSGNASRGAVGTPGKLDTTSVSGDLTVRFDRGTGARYRVNTVGGCVLIDNTSVKGLFGKGFERVDGELAGTWLDLGANSVSGSVSILPRHDSEASSTASGWQPSEFSTGHSREASGAASWTTRISESGTNNLPTPRSETGAPE